MTHFQVNSPHVIHEIIDGEAVLVNLQNGNYYSIDRVGAVVWAYMEQGFSTGQIMEAISSRYEGDRAGIEQGVQQLLDQLQAEQLIVAGQAGPVPEPVSSPNGPAGPQAKSAFEAPVLNKYTDMEALLLLDPIHDVDESGWPNTNPNNIRHA